MFHWPRGVSIETESRDIYVADMYNCRIQIFSETGNYLNQFGHQHLYKPWGILVYLDSIYITDIGHHAIFLYKLPDIIRLKQVGNVGSGNEEFNYPSQLAISPNQHLYVPDQCNDRIQILSTDLDFRGSIQHQTMTRPVDVKFTNNEMFVLSRGDNPCIHVYNLSGEKSRSLVTGGGIGMQVSGAFFFYLDRLNNIVISDNFADNIKIFSPEGDLLHTIGHEGEELGTFYRPYGIAILNNTKLICLSQSPTMHCKYFHNFLSNITP